MHRRSRGIVEAVRLSEHRSVPTFEGPFRCGLKTFGMSKLPIVRASGPSTLYANRLLFGAVDASYSSRNALPLPTCAMHEDRESVEDENKDIGADV